VSTQRQIILAIAAAVVAALALVAIGAFPRLDMGPRVSSDADGAQRERQPSTELVGAEADSAGSRVQVAAESLAPVSLVDREGRANTSELSIVYVDADGFRRDVRATAGFAPEGPAPHVLRVDGPTIVPIECIVTGDAPAAIVVEPSGRLVVELSNAFGHSVERARVAVGAPVHFGVDSIDPQSLESTITKSATEFASARDLLSRALHMGERAVRAAEFTKLRELAAHSPSFVRTEALVLFDPPFDFATSGAKGLAEWTAVRADEPLQLFVERHAPVVVHDVDGALVTGSFVVPGGGERCLRGTTSGTGGFRATFDLTGFESADVEIGLWRESDDSREKRKPLGAHVEVRHIDAPTVELVSKSLAPGTYKLNVICRIDGVGLRCDHRRFEVLPDARVELGTLGSGLRHHVLELDLVQPNGASIAVEDFFEPDARIVMSFFDGYEIDGTRVEAPTTDARIGFLRFGSPANCDTWHFECPGDFWSYADVTFKDGDPPRHVRLDETDDPVVVESVDAEHKRMTLCVARVVDVQFSVPSAIERRCAVMDLVVIDERTRIAWPIRSNLGRTHSDTRPIFVESVPAGRYRLLGRIRETGDDHGARSVASLDGGDGLLVDQLVDFRVGGERRVELLPRVGAALSGSTEVGGARSTFGVFTRPADPVLESLRTLDADFERDPAGEGEPTTWRVTGLLPDTEYLVGKEQRLVRTGAEGTTIDVGLVE